MNAVELVDAIIGRGFLSCGDAEFYARDGLAYFSGNQHNPEWTWDRTRLAGLSSDHLLTIYGRPAMQAATVHHVAAGAEEDAAIINCARVCHEVNRAYCLALGDASQPSWDEAPEWMGESAIAGVLFHLANPAAGPEASHNSWMAAKLADGWKYGKVKDADKKEHPCMVPFHHLPTEQQAKDFLFRGVVHAMLVPNVG